MKHSMGWQRSAVRLLNAQLYTDDLASTQWRLLTVRLRTVPDFWRR